MMISSLIQDDFVEIGQAFEEATGLVRIGKIGDVAVRLMPQRELVDFAVQCDIC